MAEKHNTRTYKFAFEFTASELIELRSWLRIAKQTSENFDSWGGLEEGLFLDLNEVIDGMIGPECES